MTWVAVGIALAAAAASAYNTQRTARRQDQQIAAGIREKSKVQRRADQKIQEELDRLQQSTPQAEQQGAVQQYRDALRGTQQNAQAGQALSGLSAEYDAATGAAQQRTGGYLSEVIDSLSRVDAAGLQRQREGISAGNLGTDLRVLGREGEGIDFLANMRARGVRRNPYIDALAAGLNAYAGGVGGASSGAASASNAGGTATNFGAGLARGLGG